MRKLRRSAICTISLRSASKAAAAVSPSRPAATASAWRAIVTSTLTFLSTTTSRSISARQLHSTFAAAGSDLRRALFFAFPTPRFAAFLPAPRVRMPPRLPRRSFGPFLAASRNAEPLRQVCRLRAAAASYGHGALASIVEGVGEPQIRPSRRRTFEVAAASTRVDSLYRRHLAGRRPHGRVPGRRAFHYFGRALVRLPYPSLRRLLARATLSDALPFAPGVGFEPVLARRCLPQGRTTPSALPAVAPCAK